MYLSIRYHIYAVAMFCLVPVLFGDGVRMFEHLKTTPIELESPHVRVGKEVTHPSHVPHRQVTDDSPVLLFSLGRS
jgi:hypothetical protein